MIWLMLMNLDDKRSRDEKIVDPKNAKLITTGSSRPGCDSASGG
jgi:hypothetical protein